MASEFEPLDLLQGILPGRFSLTACGHGQAGAVVGAPQLGGHEQDFVPQRLQGGVLKIRRQAEPFEPVHQIVGQQEQMEVGLVGEEVAGGDAA